MANKPYTVHQGGLMRCCLASLDDYQVEKPDDKEDVEGDVVPCKHCSSSVIFRDGAWRWNREELNAAQ